MSAASSNILAIDSALSGCGVAVSVAGQIFSERQFMARGQAEQLAPMIERVMEEAGIAFSALDLIVCTTGPGAFTGLRLGMSAAKSMALSLQVPLLGVSTFDAMAAKFLQENVLEGNQKLGLIFETKRIDYYFQIFNSGGSNESEPSALKLEDLSEALIGDDIVLIGDAVERFQNESAALPGHIKIIPGFEAIDPEILIYLAQKNAGKENAENGGGYLDVKPLYLRPADVSMPKVLPRQISESP